MNPRMPTIAAPVYRSLRQFVRSRPRPSAASCAAIGLAAEHSHLVEPASRQLVCSCDACSILFSGQQSRAISTGSQRRRVLAGLPTDRCPMGRSTSTDQPGLFHDKHAGRPRARLLPESGRGHRIAPGARGLARLGGGEPDPRPTRAGCRSTPGQSDEQGSRVLPRPIDECYKLVGLIRANWRGLSGGSGSLGGSGQFFTRLKKRSRSTGG